MRGILKQLIWLECLSLFSTSSAAIPISEAEAYNKNGEKLHHLSRRNAPSETSPTVIYPQNVSNTPIEVVTQILNVQSDPDPDVIRNLVAFDATYVSLSFDNPVLHQIMPWAGTRYRVGPQAFLDTFTRVGLWWQRGPVQIQAIFGDGGNVTAWGEYTLTSTVMNRTITGPWAVRAQVNSDGLITYLQFMEDTFLTASSFWDKGSKEYTADPYGGSVWL